jgi:hypothetical protein
MAIAKDNNQAIKIGGFKQEQGRIKAIYTDGLVTNVIDIDGLKKQMDSTRPSLQPDLGSAFNKLKGMLEKKKDDKAFLTKAKEVIKKLKETVAVIVPKTATGPQIDQIVGKNPNITAGQQIDIIRK